MPEKFPIQVKIEKILATFSIVSQLVYAQPHHHFEIRKVNNKEKEIEIKVKQTAYNLLKNQTDKDPFVAAWNIYIPKAVEVAKRNNCLGLIAVSRDLIKKYGLKDGKIVYIDGDKYVVADVMNSRFKNKIDILVFNGQNNKYTKDQKRRDYEIAKMIGVQDVNMRITNKRIRLPKINPNKQTKKV